MTGEGRGDPFFHGTWVSENLRNFDVSEHHARPLTDVIPPTGRQTATRLRPRN